MEVRRLIFYATQRKGLDRAVSRSHSAVDHAGFVKPLGLQVMHGVIGIIRRRVAHSASGLAVEERLALEFGSGCPRRVQCSVYVEFGGRWEVEDLLKLGHEMNLAPPFQDIDSLFGRNHRVAVKVCGALLKLGKILDALQCPLGTEQPLNINPSQGRGVYPRSDKLAGDQFIFTK